MRSGSRSFAVGGLALLVSVGLCVDDSWAQQPVRLETVFPAQLPRGQTTVLNVAFPGRDVMVQAAEISPSAGITVSGIKAAAESQGIAWWELSVAVTEDASPGPRALTLVLPMGRTTPITVSIPSHVPSLSDLKVVSRAGQPMLDLSFVAADASGDLGAQPYVWFTTGCGGTSEPLVGAVRGTVNAGRVRASVPSPRATQDGPAGAGACELRVRATDAGGIESNTLKATLDFN